MEEENNFLILPDNNPLLNFSKKDISSIVSNVSNRLNEGFEDPIKALVIGRKLDELAKVYNESIRQFVSGKIRLQKGEELVIYGTSITEGETGVRYDYSKCNDGEWDFLTSQIEPLLEKRKAREEFLKTLRKEFIDEDTGEVIQPPLRTGKMGYKLSFKK